MLLPWSLLQGRNLSSVRAGEIGLNFPWSLTLCLVCYPTSPTPQEEKPRANSPYSIPGTSGQWLRSHIAWPLERSTALGGGRSRGLARLLKMLRPVPAALATPRAASHCTMVQGIPDLGPGCRWKSLQNTPDPTPPLPRSESCEEGHNSVCAERNSFLQVLAGFGFFLMHRLVDLFWISIRFIWHEICKRIRWTVFLLSLTSSALPPNQQYQFLCIL